MKKLLIILFCTFVVLSLEAGQEIVLKPGTHIKAGADVLLKINYESCPGRDRPCDVQGMAQNNSFNETASNHISENDDVDDFSVSSDKILENTVKVFPNPTTNSFTIETSDNTTMQILTVYTISGELMDRVEINTTRYLYEKQLNQGTYLLVIQTNNDKIVHKKMIVL